MLGKVLDALAIPAGLRCSHETAITDLEAQVRTGEPLNPYSTTPTNSSSP